MLFVMDLFSVDKMVLDRSADLRTLCTRVPCRKAAAVRIIPGVVFSKDTDDIDFVETLVAFSLLQDDDDDTPPPCCDRPELFYL